MRQRIGRYANGRRQLERIGPPTSKASSTNEAVQPFSGVAILAT